MTTQQKRSQSKILGYLIPLLILILVLAACNAPTQDPGGPPPTEPGQAQASEVPDNPAPPADTTAPEPPAATPTPSPTLPPTLTSTPMPLVNITGNTNCRFGPGSVYDLLHTYLAGDQAQLLAISPDGFFWYTSDEAGIIPDCWLWGKYATPVGDTDFLPVFTPPPTPTPFPDFTVSYEGSDCGAGSCWLWFKINNTGSVSWESVLVYAKNLTVYDVATHVSNKFQTGIMGSDIPSIPVGATGYTHSERLVQPEGDTVDVIIVACEKDGLTELCQARNLTVNP
jgi:hypothetical protein